MDLITHAEVSTLSSMQVTREPQAPPPAPYASRAEMHRDMADPRYRTDSVFRRAVAMRVAARHATR